MGGLGRIDDNSFLTHLATGRLILDTGSIPTADPYTFTASGADWVVQSWLASWVYAWVEKLGGGDGLRILTGVLCASLAALVWRLSRPTRGLVVRSALGALVVAIGASLWVGRPLLFGLVALALTVLVAEDGLDPRWLLPVGWLWVNMHGSFPLGIVYLVVLAVGLRLDAEHPVVALRALRWLGAGMVLAAINPIGPRLLVFPLDLLQNQEVLQHVTEWQAPVFRELPERLFLLQLLLAILALVRRPRWSDAALVVVFGAAALIGARNITVTSIVLVPVLARAWPDVGSLRSEARERLAPLVAAVAVATAAVVGVSELRDPAFELDALPIHALATLEGSGVDLEAVRLATPERVGNLLEVVHGAGRRVFYDDRFDMFPASVSQDAVTLFRARPPMSEVLTRHEIDLVLWTRALPLTQVLTSDPAWRVLEHDAGWVLLCRRDAVLGGDLGRC